MRMRPVLQVVLGHALLEDVVHDEAHLGRGIISGLSLLAEDVIDLGELLGDEPTGGLHGMAFDEVRDSLQVFGLYEGGDPVVGKLGILHERRSFLPDNKLYTIDCAHPNYRMETCDWEPCSFIFIIASKHNDPLNFMDLSML